MRVNGGGIDQLASGIDHRHFHASPQPRIKAQRGFGAGRCGQQQVFEVGGEHLDRLHLGGFAHAAHQLGF